MRKTIILIIGIVLIFAFSDTRQNSFSQQMKVQSARQTFTKPQPVNHDSIKLASKLDSFQIETERAKDIFEARKKIIKTQVAARGLLENLDWMINQTLKDLKAMGFDSTLAKKDSAQITFQVFPAIAELKPATFKEDLKPIKPDTIIIKIEKKKKLGEKILFWKNK